jgi:hypothetical protein
MDDPLLDVIDPNGNFAPETPNLVRSPPTWQFLANALNRMQDVELLITIDDGTKIMFGHYVTLIGFEFTDTNMDGMFSTNESGKVHFIDSAGTDESDSLRTRDFFQRADGRLYWKRPDNAEINVRFAVEESPVPEPTTSTLAMVALLLIQSFLGRSGRARTAVR